jgi:hypothetical protein
MSFKINIDSNLDSSTVCLSQSTLEKAGINSDTIILHFGQMTKKLVIKINNELSEDTFIIPKRLTAVISIPKVPYEIKLEENQLHIGPVIGYIPESYYYSTPKILRPRFAKYNEINGLIIIFRPNGINRLNKTIKGYFFDPKAKLFVRGIFPYPKAVFSRDYLPKTVLSLFQGKLYNHPYNLDKLKFQLIMSKDPELKKHIPKTKTFSNIESVLEMLSNYNSLYFKPYNLSQGRGILHLKNDTEGGFLLSDILGNHYSIKSKEELTNELKEKIKDTYIVQQEIISILDNKKVDFRAYFYKNQSKEWYFSGMETKISKEASIISNFKNRENMMLGEEALSTLFQLDDEKIKGIRDKIVQLCIRALKLLEKNGFRLGEAAVDMVIDKQLTIWLLEIQLNFAAEKKLNRAKEEGQLLSETLPASFNYAKALAGFGKNNNI